MRIASPLLALIASSICAAQGPWLGGQREIVLGLVDHKAEVLGLYVNRNTGTSIGNIIEKTFVETRLGWMGWKVQDWTHDGKPCKMLETDAFTTQIQKFKGAGVNNEIKSTIKVARQTYIAPTGKIVRETYQWQDQTGAFTAEAKFGNDEVELKVRGPGVNRTSTVFPAGGTGLLDAMYEPMVKAGEIVKKEKEFTVLNPLTGGVQKVKATITGHFNWNLTFIKRKGFCAQIQWPDHKQIAYIGDDGELLKVDLPSGRYLLYENLKNVDK